MRKTRGEKAITLIALIITIVVLLILAVVAINAVTGDGIIQHATNAKTSYEKAQDEENKTLSYYEAYLNANGQVGKWIQKEETKTVTDLNGEEVTVKVPSNTITKVNSDGTVQEIKIGSYVNYNPTKDKNNNDVSVSYTSVGANNTLVKNATTGEYVDQTFSVNEYTGEWKVLGIENGKVLLVSETNLKPYEMNRGQLYIIGENELNSICAIYGKGKGAESARSIKVEDINKLTGYNPEIFLNTIDSMYGKYGVKTTYTFDGANLKCKDTDGNESTYTTAELKYIENNNWVTELTRGKELNIINTTYSYTIYPNNDFRINMDMNADSEEYKIIFNDTINGYWLASKCVTASWDTNTNSIANIVAYGLFQVTKSGAISRIAETESVSTTAIKCARPVVVLDSKAELVLSSDGKSYDIKL